ncbi:MAG: TlyA family RNA methyltransferase [Epsilonproteobacteria bacterium]|nr:TlyA family RNA methyltransferase [Campylobacterota bacterium]PIP10933.1 MAG: TlyA family rRNA (cytidine-2'-O)-methyltransferase [Sulfurimonas sp. CG23_combo_of_CG06-09_8_20_14_all_36_33]PIS26792.1 MAG: TlyA family rRNA (cytidine-2'-O)-methyltransferase [Sulfurimonas sp. CG08_land_8_20_14_0_20_36_33]PIU35110.1 MAG: TlyA family rRNA (cytidine-2'-O)-methyltransferase [Sulfurimonas sp. CG07_land_8_20_14_0_80_36_56]PIV03355.1 MAG: TlyA family rRNA (cytidine-2'-O)-methyltransferase [Sulfurimonas 
MRVDNYLVENTLAGSRTKAQAMIKEGLVVVNGEVMLKPSLKVSSSDEVRVKEHKEYVSRSAHKLASFLDELKIDINSKVALDIGSSTGGFTQVLLEYGASEVTAVDVGKEQLHETLKKDARVHSFESCDIRDFKSEKQFDLVTSDVAFISLLNILDDVERLACGNIILLFKPQFEVGREAKRDKNGVVTDEKAILKAMVKFEDACSIKGWKLILKSPSKLTGKEGNLEYCYCYEK